MPSVISPPLSCSPPPPHPHNHAATMSSPPPSPRSHNHVVTLLVAELEKTNWMDR
ncbi:hypothetical protein A2U01_0054066 [Trifolium medium]|uniref:Uncharacterized protein n=1 Tax=Trifolium medium TaxID=97028 RepID=A0A392R9Q4_9FABA|nr:hypothetical protein [Trifolium medium]